MSELAKIESAQKSLEECFTKRMEELEAQLQGGSMVKDTVARVAEEFRTFRELMYSMLSLLRKQINECSRAVDIMETRHRHKALLFMGIVEVENEDCSKVVLDIIRQRLSLTNYTAASISISHRLGAPSKDHPRPILVRFSNVDLRAAVWRSKTGLKGSTISIREFLTRTRQSLFGKARIHFGTRACWTQDGIIVIKTSDGTRHKVISLEDLSPLLTKYPKVSGASSSATRRGAGDTTMTGVNKNAPRKV